jgi:hypothetical protein
MSSRSPRRTAPSSRSQVSARKGLFKRALPNRRRIGLECSESRQLLSVSSTPYAGFLAAAEAAIDPDGFGYTADVTAFENIDLAPAADVNTIADFQRREYPPSRWAQTRSPSAEPPILRRPTS